MALNPYVIWILNLTVAFSTRVLYREVFDEDHVRCLDGTKASFYHSKFEINKKDFLIYLQPGGYCHNIDTCHFRCTIAPFMCTSPNKPSIGLHEGILSDDLEQNPFFANFYKIVIPYCSGDMFTGSRETSNETDGFAFLGRAMLAGVIQKISKIAGINSARRLVLAGGSAGGAGIAFNCDYIASLLPVSVDVRCIVDGAFFYPINTDFRKEPDCENIDTVLDEGSELWGNPEVRQFSLHGAWWRKINQPLFISTASVDQFGFQSYCGEKYNKSDLTTWSKGTAQMAENLEANYENIGLFMPSCYDHMLLIDGDMFNKVKVGWQRMTLSGTLGMWLLGDTGIKVWDKCSPSEMFCNPNCANKVISYQQMGL